MLNAYKETVSFPLRQATLCFLVNGNDILLAMKKRGFGVGRWNGIGGKVLAEETVEEAVIREAKEEIGIIPITFMHVGTLDFYLPYDPDSNQQVIVFFVENWKGDPIEGVEMAPRWFAKQKIPFDSMWPDDKLWFPKVLEGRKIKAEFLFGEGDQVLDFTLTDLSS
jgi:8-oxo-dGTP diphosphatase/2-hydroxy-dATP diphosphatase